MKSHSQAACSADLSGIRGSLGMLLALGAGIKQGAEPMLLNPVSSKLTFASPKVHVSLLHWAPKVSVSIHI